MMLSAILAAGCSRSSTRVPGGELTAEWLGSDTGGISVKPVAVWCGDARTLRITAIKGDIGLGLMLYPKQILRKGMAEVFDPGVDTAIRPGVAVVGRWVRDKAIVAFQSDSGSLTYDSSETGLGGRFEIRLRGLNGNDTIRMTGHYGGITPDPCPADSTAHAGRPG